jgi:hypothetical protein
LVAHPRPVDAVNPLLEAFLASPSIESAVGLLSAADLAMQAIRDFKRQAEESVVEYIEREGAFAVGEKVYCVAKDTIEKSTMPSTEGFDYLLEKCGGDLDAVKGLLKSDCFKAGAVEKTCGADSRKKMFVKVVRTVLDEKEGTERILKKLVRADRRYLPNVPTRGEIIDDAGDFDE